MFESPLGWHKTFLFGWNYVALKRPRLKTTSQNSRIYFVQRTADRDRSPVWHLVKVTVRIFTNQGDPWSPPLVRNATGSPTDLEKLREDFSPRIKDLPKSIRQPVATNGGCGVQSPERDLDLPRQDWQVFNRRRRITHIRIHVNLIGETLEGFICRRFLKVSAKSLSSRTWGDPFIFRTRLFFIFFTCIDSVINFRAVFENVHCGKNEVIFSQE